MLSDQHADLYREVRRKPAASSIVAPLPPRLDHQILERIPIAASLAADRSGPGEIRA
jgi:hypothetical protein